jgi:ferric-dicitrate binding protein FerR (iron transport regulator)
MENEKTYKSDMDELLFLYLKGEATDEERTKAREWINEKTENRKHFDSLKELYFSTAFSSNKYDRIEGWKKIEKLYYREMYQKALDKTKLMKQRLIRLAVSSAAAIVLLLMTVFYVSHYATHNNKENTLSYNEINVPLGSKSQITLVDGTRVWLNAGSKLRYPIHFGEKSREVYLEGEGFFDVTHNSQKSFLVKTTGITIKVYGTQFNVKAYGEEENIITTLVKGSITIEVNKGKGSPMYLKPNETAIFSKSITDKLLIKAQDKIESITSWKDNRWIIEGETLGNLATMLERKYNVKIEIVSEELKNYKFTGILTDESFEQVMKIIQLTIPVQFTINHKFVTIKEDKLYKLKYDHMINK